MRDIFFFLWSPYVGDEKDQWGTYFFLCEVLVRDIFFKSIFCKSALRTLRSLRSLRATAGLRPAMACASLGKFLWKISKIEHFPSKANVMAGRRPVVARSERSERSVRKALLQKIDLKNMSHTMTSQKKNVSLIDISAFPYKDYTEKKYVPKNVLIFLIPNTWTSQKKKYVP